MKISVFCLRLLNALSVSTLLAFNSQAHGADYVQISLSKLDSDHVELKYTLPKSCEKIPFSINHLPAKHFRKDWLALDKCGEVSTEGMLTKAPNCKTVRFSVKVQATAMDRVYPPAYPITSEGILLHTGIFALDNSCGNISWSFNAPKGAIVIDGDNRGTKILISESKYDAIKFTSVFISDKPQPKTPKLIKADNVPPWLAAGIREASSTVTDYYTKTYFQLGFQAPTLFVSNMIKGGDPDFQADVSARRTIRFGLVDYPTIPDQELLNSLKGTVAHEFAHLLQPSKRSPDNFDHEGGAEFIRWITEYKLGWRDKAELSKDFSDALTYCLNTTNGKAWKNVNRDDVNLGYAVYRCGLALHVIGLASRQTTDSAEEAIHGYYQALKLGTEVDFASALECGTVKPCNSPSWLSKVFTSDTSFEKLVDDQLKVLNIIEKRSYAEDHSSMAIIRRNAFKFIMSEDCGDATGFYTKSNNFLTDDVPPQCQSIRSGLSIENVNGVSYFKTPYEAAAAQSKGCNENHFVILGTLDGQTIKVACSNKYSPHKTYAYDINIDKLLMLLVPNKTNLQLSH